MDIPELVQEHLGGEQLRTGVMLGDEDVVCITPTRTLLYRADGLLSDESVTEYSHEVERLQLKEGRRKTKFVLEYVDGTETFTVPNDVSRDVLGLLLEGILTVEQILEDGESVTGAFRFSELTLVVGEHRVVKHVGGSVWEEDFEMFSYDDLTGLEFEKASVATEVVLRIEGRPQRIKTPNDKARIVEQTVKKAVFEHFDVTSMGELDDHFAAEAAAREEMAEETESNDEREANDDIGLAGGSGIDPLVDDDSGSDDSPFADPLSTPAAESDPARESGQQTSERQQTQPSGQADQPSTTSHGEQSLPGGAAAADPLTEDDLDEVMDQLTELTEAVNRQNELLRNQQQAIKQLVTELRQGR